MSEPTDRKKGGERLIKGERPPKQKREKKPDNRTKQEIIRHRLFVTATVVAAVIVALFLGYNWLFAKPNVEQKPTPPPVEASGEPIEGKVPSTNTSGRKKDFYTFLVIGRDTGGGGNTDTVLLASYDVANQDLNVMSIPRDTMVNVSWDIKKINSIYSYKGGDDKGIAALNDEISQLVGFRPDFQVVVEWKAVGELVDALGGVYFDVPRNMNYDDPTQDLHIHQKKGYRKLTGDDAMQVIRYRHDNNLDIGYRNGDLGRIETQQAFLKAVVEQCLKIENMTRVSELAKVFTQNVKTNLSLTDIAYFAKEAIFGGLSMDNVNFVTMPNEGKMVWSRSIGQKLSYVVPITDELVDLVNKCFNPYLDDLSAKDLDIMYVTSDGNIASTTGVVADKKANAAWQAAKNTPKATPTPVVTPTPTASVEPTESPAVSGSPAPTTSATPTPTASAPVTGEQPTQAPVETPVATPAPTPPPAEPEGPPEGIPIS